MLKPRLIVIAGATATGKTDLAFALAQSLKTEIISFDSVQVYKRLDIGTAKPPKSYLSALKHHLIDEIEPTETFTAGDFKRRAEEMIHKISLARRPVVLVGGTGFYLQALLKGMYEIPQVSPEIKEEIQVELKEKGNQALYDELAKLDPVYANKVHPHDSYRIARGLELFRSGAKSISQIQSDFSTDSESPFVTEIFGLARDRQSLLQSVQARAQKMVNDGLIEETRQLLKEFPRGLKALESVGYKETVEFLEGTRPLLELAPGIVRSTMQLAKRQNTWFKRDKSIQWLETDKGSEILVKTVLDRIKL